MFDNLKEALSWFAVAAAVSLLALMVLAPFQARAGELTVASTTSDWRRATVTERSSWVAAAATRVLKLEGAAAARTAITLAVCIDEASPQGQDGPGLRLTDITAACAVMTGSVPDERGR